MESLVTCRHWWVSAGFATGSVQTTEGLQIVFVPPIWKKFHGRPLRDLLLWLEKKGGVLFEELT